MLSGSRARQRLYASLSLLCDFYPENPYVLVAIIQDTSSLSSPCDFSLVMSIIVLDIYIEAPNYRYIEVSNFRYIGISKFRYIENSMRYIEISNYRYIETSIYRNIKISNFRYIEVSNIGHIELSIYIYDAYIYRMDSVLCQSIAPTSPLFNAD